MGLLRRLFAELRRRRKEPVALIRRAVDDGQPPRCASGLARACRNAAGDAAAAACTCSNPMRPGSSVSSSVIQSSSRSCGASQRRSSERGDRRNGGLLHRDCDPRGTGQGRGVPRRAGRRNRHRRSAAARALRVPLPDGRCSLQVAAVALGHHKWAFKPTPCWLFRCEWSRRGAGRCAMLSTRARRGRARLRRVRVREGRRGRRARDRGARRGDGLFPGALPAGARALRGRGSRFRVR